MKSMKTNTKLTTVELQVYKYLERYIGANQGGAPTVREIKDAVGMSSISHVSYILDALEDKGYIIKRRGRSRGIYLVEREDRPVMAATRPDDISVEERKLLQERIDYWKKKYEQLRGEYMKLRKKKANGKKHGSDSEPVSGASGTGTNIDVRPFASRNIKGLSGDAD